MSIAIMFCFDSLMAALRENGDPLLTEVVVAYVNETAISLNKYQRALGYAFSEGLPFPVWEGPPADRVAAIQALDPMQKGMLLQVCYHVVAEWWKQLHARWGDTSDPRRQSGEYQADASCADVLERLCTMLRGERLIISEEEELRALLRRMGKSSGYCLSTLDEVFQFLETNYAQGSSSRSLRAYLRTILNEHRRKSPSWNDANRRSECEELIKRGEAILTFCEGHGEEWFEPYVPQWDSWTLHLGDVMKELPESRRGAWITLLQTAAMAKGTKPSKAFLKKAKEVSEVVSEHEFREFFDEVEAGFGLPGPVELKLHETGALDFTLVHREVLDLLRGIVWLAGFYPNARTFLTMERVMDKAFEKLVCVGPRCEKVGQAVIDSLLISGDERRESRFRCMIQKHGKNKNVKKRLEKALLLC